MLFPPMPLLCFCNRAAKSINTWKEIFITLRANSVAVSLLTSVESLHLSYKRCLRFALGAITQRNFAKQKNKALSPSGL